MRFGNFSLMIPEGVERDSGYVGLPHGQQYTIRIVNHHHTKCDAEVTVDGKVIGTFRLHPHETTNLERAPDDHGRFTFYSSGTREAVLAQEGAVLDDNKGLIQVRFVPEKPPQYRPNLVRTASFGPTRGVGGQSMSSFAPEREEKTSGGITGLSGHSGQRFESVGPIDRDEVNAVIITIRLVTFDGGPRPLRSVPVAGNPVPPPV